MHLGFLYLSGRGVERNLEKTAQWYLEAYQILTNKHKIKELYVLLYGMDGLILLLLSLDRISEARNIGQEFLDMLESESIPDVPEDWVMLWKAEALVENSDIHFDISIDRERYQQVKSDIEKALSILNDYKGTCKDKAMLLKGKAESNMGELLKLTGDKKAALQYFEYAGSLLKEAAEICPTQEYRKVYSGCLCSLGLLQRDIAIDESMRHPAHSIELMHPARRTFEKVLSLDRELVKEEPTINNREGLAIALFNLSLVLQDKWEVKNCLQEAWEIVEKLQAETRDGSFDNLEREIKTMFRKRHIRQETRK